MLGNCSNINIAALKLFQALDLILGSMCMSVFPAYVSVSVTCECLNQRGKRRILDLLALKIPIGVSQHFGPKYSILNQGLW